MRSMGTTRLIAGFAVIWQLISVVTYLSLVGILGDSAHRPGQPPMPEIVNVCYAIGAFAGLAGAAALFFLRWWSLPLLWLSMAGLFVEWGWVLGHHQHVSRKLAVGALMVSIILVLLAERARRYRRLA